MLLPAIEAGRESARAYLCRARLHHVGVALRSYHDHHGKFPPAAKWGSEGLSLASLDQHKDPTPVQVTRQNWIQLLLPNLDQMELYQQFDVSIPVGHEQSGRARMTSMPSIACPSDPYNRQDNPYRMPLPDGSFAEFARGNYAINGGSEYVPAAFGTLSNPGPTHSRYVFDEETREFQFMGNGVAGINGCLSLKDFRNGQATLVAVEEVRAGLASVDTRGVWALGQVGASITWGHGVIGDDGAPNSHEPGVGADDIRQGGELYKIVGRELVEAERMQVCEKCDENTQATARSKHEGGVNVLTLDGAVHFVSDAVEPTLWHVMHSRETPPEVLAQRFADEIDGVFDLSSANAPRPLAAASAEQSANSTSAPQPLENSVGMRFVQVPAGEFTMGVADADFSFRFPSDAVPHLVRITRDYLLGKYEVTQEQYATVMGVNPSWHAASGEGAFLIQKGETEKWPVDNVSWDNAVEFCRRLGEFPEERAAGRSYRLPTEAEWERACRAGRAGAIENRPWQPDDPTGEIVSKRLPKGVVLLPKDVGSYPPNAFGLFDMCGNVFEWTADYRRRGYYEASPVDDPQGPATGYLRVIRGWHWVATGPACTVYVANEPWTGSKFIGFRVVCMQGDAAAGAP